MTIVCEAPEHAAHRIRASLYKLEITVDVDEVGRSEAVIRELCLIKVAAGPTSPLGQASCAPSTPGCSRMATVVVGPRSSSDSGTPLATSRP